MPDNPDDNPHGLTQWQIARLFQRLDKIEAMTSEHSRNSAEKLEQISIDVAVLKSEAGKAEERAKRHASIVSAVVSSIIAAVATVWQTLFHR